MARIVWQELGVPTAHVSLHIRRVIEPPSPPILLLHGLGVSGTVWQPFARRLAPAFAALAPDLRGHGDSHALEDDYSQAAYASDLGILLTTLLDAPVPVVGHSLGALVALALADARPDLVSALILVDPPVDPGRPNPDVPQVYRLRHQPPDALEAYLLAVNPAGGHSLAQSLARLFRQTSDGPFETMLAAPLGHPEMWERAERVSLPTLLVQADPAYGGLLGDVTARAFASRFAAGRLLKIPGATHSVHASHPAELAAGVLAFLAEVRP